MHNGQLVACWVGEVEAAATREAEDWECDFAAGFQDGLFGLLEIFGLDNREWSFGVFGGIGVETALGAASGKCRVGWAIVLEGPAEEVGVEGFGGVEIVSGKFEVNNL